MKRPAADGRELPVRRRRLAFIVVSPTDRAAVRAQGARVSCAAAYGRELSIRRRRLAIIVLSPTDRAAVGTQGACVGPAAAYGHESLVGGRGCSPLAIVPPADRAAVGSERAGMSEAQAEKGCLIGIDDWRRRGSRSRLRRPSGSGSPRWPRRPCGRKRGSWKRRCRRRRRGRRVGASGGEQCGEREQQRGEGGRLQQEPP